MTGGNGWHKVAATVDYWRDAEHPRLYRVLVSIGKADRESWCGWAWWATVDDFGNLVEVLQ
jgi:hypothetical protein